MGNLWRVAMVGLLLSAACLVYAEERKDAPAERPMMHPGMMMGEDSPMPPPSDRPGKDKMAEMMPMCMMMHSMMGKELVATQDGGVVVLVGNKLQKYDKNLQLIKEVEVKQDKGAMPPMMMDKMGGCPGKKKMMEDK